MSTKPVYRGNEAFQRVGLGRTKFFEEVKSGRLVVARSGRVLLLTEERAQEYLRSCEVVVRPNVGR
jgi:hypothetical protein